MYYILEIIAVFVFIFYLSKKTNDNYLEELKKIDFKEMIKYSVLFVLLIMTIYLILNHYNLITINKMTINHLLSIRYLLSITLTPVLEEYIFRYLPIKMFKNKTMIVLLGSLIFTLSHNVNVYEGIVIFISSVLMYLIYIKTDKISNTITCHSLWNLSVLLISVI